MSYGDPSKYITSLCVDPQCQDHPYTREIIKRSGLPVTLVNDHGTPEVDGIYPENLTRGKQTLFLCQNRGRFFKSCPGTREYNCCGYQVLNIGMNCPMDCVYCILQAYLNNPWLSFFVNIDDLFTELDVALLAEPDRLFRIGTGEFTDSLAIDRLTGFSRHLISYIREKNNVVLELKTKSTVIENLQGIDHGGRVIVAWSLNSPAIMDKEEIRTATLDERLAAAAHCAELGYRLAFHFDPIIWHDGWQEGYSSTIEKLFQAVPKESIVWISLGALRFLPHLKTIATSRFTHSRFFYEEFVEGLDGKSRYFRNQRVEMYKFIVDKLSRFVSDRTCVYFCMESDVIWQEIFGFKPEEKGGLSVMLDQTLM